MLTSKIAMFHQLSCLSISSNVSYAFSYSIILFSSFTIYQTRLIHNRFAASLKSLSYLSNLTRVIISLSTIRRSLVRCCKLLYRM